MGVKTFALFKSELTLALENRSDVSTYAGTWVNDAYMDLCTRDMFWGSRYPLKFSFRELEATASANTVNGTAYVSTPADCLYVYAVHNTTSDRKLTQLALRDYAHKTGRADTNAEGDPQYWVRSGSYIYLYPTPDATYALTMYYRKRPAVLSGESDVTVLGAEWDEPVLTLAIIKGMMRLHMYDQAKLEKAAWDEMMESKIALASNEEQDRNAVLKPNMEGLDYGY
jgi:hypothetical protein